MAPPASKRQATPSRGRQRAAPGKPAKRAVSARAPQLWPGRRKDTPLAGRRGRTQPRADRVKGAQPWSGRFGEPVSELVQRFTASVGFDRRLALHDIAGSRAHARMLAAGGIISRADCDDIERGLAAIRSEVESGRFHWSLEAEDVHLNIERRLTELVGEAGKRLHTARSRNDQVATDVRLWLRDEIDAIDARLVQLQDALLAQAGRHAALVMPGFTHLQVAQPVTFGHHLMAYFEMLERDRERLAGCRRRVNVLPLGAAALAGTTFPIDRERVARELGFDGVCANSLDAVSDRDFAVEFCALAALAMVHLSRLAEELVLWMSPRFGFIRMPDRFTTGSSIMPQKKNPDVPELVRGKSARVIGDLTALLALMKSQPLAYNKDNQEDKEPLFDAVDTLKDSLAVFAELVAGIEPLPEAMRAAALEGFATATDLADYLVRKGVPFRDAHGIVARAVREAETIGCDLSGLPLAVLRRFSDAIGEDVFACLSLEGSVAARDHPGGTAPRRVSAAVARARARRKMP
jgi:argininosuccinate lyase